MKINTRCLFNTRGIYLRQRNYFQPLRKGSKIWNKLVRLLFYYKEPRYRSRYSYRLRAGRPRGGSSSPGMVKNFLFSTPSRLALGSTQAPVQWVPGVKRPECEADQLVPRLRKCGSIYPLPHKPSRRSA
jgi:hypothetical protein